MNQETLCHYCEKPIPNAAKCGALICWSCCRECKEENDGICPERDLKYADAMNRRARTNLK